MNTPDGDNASLVGADVGIRALSTIVDGIILAIVGGIIMAALGSNFNHGHLSGLQYFWSLVLGFAYFTYFEGKQGATPGKLLCGLKVVKTDGAACDVTAATVRTVARIIDGLFAYLIAAVLVWLSGRNQRLGDKLAGTLVIRIR